MNADQLIPICHNCGSSRIEVIPDLARTITIGPGYDITIAQSHLLNFGDATFATMKNDLVMQVARDFDAGRIRVTDLQKHNRAYEIEVPLSAKCLDCAATFTVNSRVSLWLGLQYRGVFEDRLRRRVDDELQDTLGISLDHVSKLTQQHSLESAIVDTFYHANATKYSDLKELKDYTYSLPIGKGGDGITQLLSMVLFSLLTAALYDLAKYAGKTTFRQIRASLSKRKLRRTLARVLQERKIDLTTYDLNERQNYGPTVTSSNTDSPRKNNKRFLHAMLYANSLKFRNEILQSTSKTRRRWK